MGYAYLAILANMDSLLLAGTANLFFHASRKRPQKWVYGGGEFDITCWKCGSYVTFSHIHHVG